jgi:hypothetical protein
MTTKHTPGPWKIVGNAISAIPAELFNVLIGVGDEDGECPIMAVHNVNGDYADAKLIAAAPDLLEALQWYEAKAVQMGRAAIDQDSKLLLELMKEIAVEYGSRARAAIAKATGEQL